MTTKFKFKNKLTKTIKEIHYTNIEYYKILRTFCIESFIYGREEWENSYIFNNIKFFCYL